jgi:hypothetical protein
VLEYGNYSPYLILESSNFTILEEFQFAESFRRAKLSCSIISKHCVFISCLKKQ